EKSGADFRVFGVGDPNTYLPVGARKAQGKLPKDYHKKIKALHSSDSEESAVSDMELATLEPDVFGWFSLCCPIDKAPSVDKTELESIFIQAGSEIRIHQTARWIFVRYKSKDDCRKALSIFGEEYGLCVASNKKKSDDSVVDENPKKSKKSNGYEPKIFRGSKNSGYATDIDDRRRQKKTENKLNGHAPKSCTQENGNKKPKKEKSLKSLFVHGITDK
ncbi:hypothetical protein EGW08_002760, partial [Elysia chlorotica]